MSGRVFSAGRNLGLVRACSVSRALPPAALLGVPPVSHAVSSLDSIHANNDKLGDDAGKGALPSDVAGAEVCTMQLAQGPQGRNGGCDPCGKCRHAGAET